jgi:hypothetical protein
MRQAPRPRTRWADRVFPAGWTAHGSHRPARFRAPMNDTVDHTDTGTPADDPPPAAGIRWELVNRMKKLIAEGKLDTPERWAMAEESLFRAVDPTDHR